jgi:flagellar motility protein MotE (MotC chaperone)
MKSLRIASLVLACSLVNALGAYAQQAPAPSRPADAPLTPLPSGEVFYRDAFDGFGGRQSESMQLAQQYTKAAKPEEKQEIRKKLADLLAKQFDANLQQQQKELEDVEKQIADLRALLKKRVDAKTLITERRVDQLIQDAEGLGWTAPGSINQRNMRGAMGGFRPAGGVSSPAATVPAPPASR